MALPTVVGDRGAIAGIVMLARPRTVAINPRVCDADKQVVPTLLTRPTS